MAPNPHPVRLEMNSLATDVVELSREWHGAHGGCRELLESMATMVNDLAKQRHRFQSHAGDDWRQCSDSLCLAIRWKGTSLLGQFEELVLREAARGPRR